MQRICFIFSWQRENSWGAQETSNNRNQKIFLGHFYSYKNFGHKALKCKAYEKFHEYKKDAIKKSKVRNHNHFGILQRFDIECYKCNKFGHLDRNCKLKCDAPVEVQRQWNKMAARKKRDQRPPVDHEKFQVYFHCCHKIGHEVDDYIFKGEN